MYYVVTAEGVGRAVWSDAWQRDNRRTVTHSGTTVSWCRGHSCYPRSRQTSPGSVFKGSFQQAVFGMYTYSLQTRVILSLNYTNFFLFAGGILILLLADGYILPLLLIETCSYINIIQIKHS